MEDVGQSMKRYLGQHRLNWTRLATFSGGGGGGRGGGDKLMWASGLDLFPIAQVRYIKMLTWLRDQKVKTENF